MMKLKELGICAIAAVLLLTVSACGNTAEPETTKTNEEYKENLNELLNEAEEENENSQLIDFGNAEQAEAYCARMKDIYQKMVDLEPSTGAEQAQERVSAGAQKMIEYLDALPAYLAMEQSGEEWEAKREELVGIYSEALAAIAEGKAGAEALDSAEPSVS